MSGAAAGAPSCVTSCVATGQGFAPYAWLIWAADEARAPRPRAAHHVAQDRAVLAQHGRSFDLAGRLLGRATFERAASLYAVCRAIDDLADEAPDPLAAHAVLTRIRDDLAHGGPATTQGNRFRELGVDTAAAALLVETMLSDLGPVRIADEAALLRYAHGAAGTVGLMMCDVLGVEGAVARQHAADLGIAMQLTNIARDVAEDAARDRLYLPADWLGTAATPAALDPQIIFVAVRRLLALAERHYRSGALGYGALPGRAGLAIPVAARLYRQIGRQVLAAGPDYLSGPRQVVGRGMRAALLVGCVVGRRPGAPPLDPA